MDHVNNTVFKINLTLKIICCVRKALTNFVANKRVFSQIQKKNTNHINKSIR